ncbi:hypothetical protein B0A49_02252 [Cryomyces minteri]|uniref:DUF1754-domain-containing protein n=1 Tax=Cryomyces minteri TaxID=331657 RepID=A0A4U0X059_9PEZI|nr:hypothetical protein B0A49_06930 [Cryomyces minteri]TKA74749.1 hypothetical protein B0A49_02252 [Cryomyces minteri]
MPSSDYTTTGGGLKLKGVSSAGIDKKRKKKKPKPAGDTPASKSTGSDADAKVADADGDGVGDIQKALAAEDKSERGLQDKEAEKSAGPGYGKTEAEIRHEERRRKRLDERLKREGIKTHKERVEELNKYLSNLSEHHDMPRIGPG